MNIYKPRNYGITKSVALFTNARDEKNIKEWAAHHLLIGFDKIIIDWFIYLDADEFLILGNQFIGVKHFLNHFKNAHSLGINWLFFGSNNHVSDPEGLILENYTKFLLK